MAQIVNTAKKAIQTAKAESENAYEKAKADTTRAAEETCKKIEDTTKAAADNASKSVEAAKEEALKAWNVVTDEEKYKKAADSLREVFVRGIEEGKAQSEKILREAKKICMDEVRRAGVEVGEGIESAKSYQREVFDGILEMVSELASLAGTVLGRKV